MKIPFLNKSKRKKLNIRVYGTTDVGLKRLNNEDAFLALPKLGSSTQDHALMVVADGMGGHRAGEVASQMASDNLVRHLSDPELCNTMLTGNVSESLRDIISKIKI